APEDEDKPEAETEEDETSAETEEDETVAEGDEDTDPEAEDEEDDTVAEDDEETEPKAKAAGRKAERKRIAAILGSKAGEANPALAAHLAFSTPDSAKKALAALKAAGPASANARLGNLMAGRASQTGRGGVRNSGASAGSSW